MDESNHEMVNMLTQQIGTVFNSLIQNTNQSYQMLATYLPMFLVNNRAGFGYYMQDQTINHRTCCAIFFQKVLECLSYS